MTTNKETKQVIVDMLTENTGKHFLDSGGAYGRHWQRNQVRATIEDWEETDQVTLEVWSKDDETTDDYYPIISLYHWLTNNGQFDLEFRSDLQERLNQIGDENEDQYYSDDIDMFLAELSEKYEITGLYGDDSRTCIHDNTYNSENCLSQDFIFHYFENRDTDEIFVILQIHGGCDARGGYTAPKIFEIVSDEGSYFLDWNKCYIADKSGNCWDFDGHSWEVGNVEGISEDSNQLKLIDVPADYRTVKRLQDYEPIRVTEGKRLVSPIDGTEMEVYLL
jgi:hypothetical protein